MDMRLASTHDTRRLLLAIIVALSLVMTLGATSITAASPDCRVQNTDTGKTYKALQAAVDAASKGARLTVQGTCIGATVIGKKLVIEGKRTATSDRPTLSGGGKVRVLTIRKAVRVRVRSIEVLRGGGSGILNQGTLTLVDVTVRDNKAAFAGGVRNTGTLVMEGSSRISHNILSGLGAGGGVLNEGTLTMSDQSVISGNRGFGAGVFNKGTLTMNDASSIHNNRAQYGYAYGSGGGVYNEGTLTMNDASSIRNNRAQVGGGVSNEGTLVLNGTSSIHDNVVRDYYGGGSGGGASNEGGGAVTLNDASSIHDNVAGTEGGGVYNGGTLTMTGSSGIRDNKAGDGGGVLNLGTFMMAGGSAVFGNAAEGDGGGILDLYGTLTGVVCAPQASPNVYGNTPDDCYFFKGS